MANFQVTQLAWKHISELSRQNSNLPLRLSIIAGGCNGFSYRYEFSNLKEELDFIVENNGIQVTIDDISLELLKGSTLDWEEDLMGSRPIMRNPNANSSCGCGTSFSAG